MEVEDRVEAASARVASARLGGVGDGYQAAYYDSIEVTGYDDPNKTRHFERPVADPDTSKFVRVEQQTTVFARAGTGAEAPVRRPGTHADAQRSVRREAAQRTPVRRPGTHADAQRSVRRLARGTDSVDIDAQRTHVRVDGRARLAAPQREVIRATLDGAATHAALADSIPLDGAPTRAAFADSIPLAATHAELAADSIPFLPKAIDDAHTRLVPKVDLDEPASRAWLPIVIVLLACAFAVGVAVPFLLR